MLVEAVTNRTEKKKSWRIKHMKQERKSEITVMGKKATEKKVKGMDYIWLALTAFGGLGLEALYAYLLEPMLYGCEMRDWNTWQSILHWVITCITCGLVAWYTVKSARKDCDFDLFAKSEPIKP